MGDLLDRIQTRGVDDGLFAIRPDQVDQSVRKTVSLWANYFEMAFKNPNLILYLYQMSFEAFPPKGSPPSEKEIPVPGGKKLMHVIRCALKTSTFTDIKSDIATDFSRTLISCKKLENDQMQTGQFKFWAENEIENEVPKPQKKATRFRMTLEDKGQLQLSDLLNYLASNTKREGAYENIMPIIQAVDIILNHYGKLSLEAATPKQGKCFPLDATETFNLEGPKGTPGYLRGIRGFFSSVRATTDRALVNCSVCCGAFYKPGPLEDLFALFIPSPRNATHEQQKKLEKAIQGLRVEFSHRKDENGQPIPSIRTIFGLAHPYRGPKKVEFYHKKENRNYTVADYWKMQGYKPIQNFEYPVINVGNKDNPNYMPSHVCTIVSGQMAKRKLDSLQNSDMIKYAIREPEATRKSINADAFKVLRFENNFTLNSFGISLESEMVTVQGRVLEQPKVIYETGSAPRDIDNRARWNLRGVSQVFKPGHLANWGVLRITRDENDWEGENKKFDETFSGTSGFMFTLRKSLGSKNVANPIDKWRQSIYKGGEAALGQSFDNCAKKDIRFLLVVLPDNDASTYKQIKFLGDVERGINTVCVLGENTKEKFYKSPVATAVQYFVNVALKINLKLGGTNHILQNQKPLYKNTMVIGIDVTHPSPGPTKKTAPSVAAMVASVDDELAQWPVDLRINTAGKEMVELLGPMLRTRLELWKGEHRDTLPDNLLIYRDGVSESQYRAVLNTELGQLRDTCKVMYRGRVPKITLIIVGKRHHTRFFKMAGPTNSTNPEFGTVVDTGVTEARNWDFFLQSHHALKGTARPAHYFVLLNEIFTQDFVGRNVNISDYLQKLTYDMCFLFGRSTGPVSIPPPVYYADLACERSRCYGDFDDDTSDTSSMVGDDKGNPHASRREAQAAPMSHGSGSQALNRPGPSSQGPSTQNKQGPGKQIPSSQKAGYTAPGKKEDVSKKPLRPTETKPLDLMAGLTKKEKARLFDQRTAAASQKTARGGSSKAEGKKPESKPESKPEPKPESKPEAKPEAQPEAQPEAKAKGKQSEGKAEGKKPEEKVERPKAEEKKAETKAEVQKPETEAEANNPKEKAKIEIHRDVSKMFYI